MMSPAPTAANTASGAGSKPSPYTLRAGPVADQWEIVYEIEYESVPIRMARHKRTGMALCLAEVKSPLVNGYFSVHTEAFDDCGEPHTLEHLIFMGSKNYPYKGVLDLLANQCLAQGTNAWTDTDNTTYTIETAGAEGFLQIFPVYMDHMLYPTLTDSAYTTEIHHIDGEGVDSGVVYCEMQARENEMDDIMEYVRKEMLFSDKNKSLKAETGGRLHELRAVLSNERIRDYHTKYYMPHNVCAIVCGQADLSDCCEALIPVLAQYPEERLNMYGYGGSYTGATSNGGCNKSSKANGTASAAAFAPEERSPTTAKKTFARPFSTPVEVLSSSKYKEIYFPAEDDESGGCVQVSWFGPKWENFDDILACETLLTYFTKDSSSALRKRFSDPTDAGMEPLCANVSFGKLEVAATVITVELEDVNLENVGLYLHSAEKKIDDLIVDVFATEQLDLARLHSLLELGKRKHLQRLESAPHDAYSDFLISEFLFGPTFDDDAGNGGGKGREAQPGSVLLDNMSKTKRYNRLLSESEFPVEKWQSLLRKYFVDNHRVCLFGRPSKEAAEKLQTEETSRLDAQKKKLGEEGMGKKAQALTAADEKNGMDPPQEVLQSSVTVPDLRKVQLIDCKTVQLGGTPPAASNRKSNVRVQIDSIAGAQFCDLRLLFPFDGLLQEDAESQAVLASVPIWRQLAFQSPLRASKLGPALTAEETQSKVTELFNQNYCRVSDGKGAQSQFGVGTVGANCLFFYCKVAKESAREGAKFLLRLKEDVVFTAEKVKLAASRLMNVLPQEKRQGWPLCTVSCRALLYADDSMNKVVSWPAIVKDLGIFGGGGKGGGEDEDGGGEGEDEENDAAGDEDGDGDAEMPGAESPEDVRMESKASHISDAAMGVEVAGAENVVEEPEDEAAKAALEEAKQKKVEEIIGNLEKLQRSLNAVAMHVGGEVPETEHSFFAEELWASLAGVGYQPMASWATPALESEEVGDSVLLTHQNVVGKTSSSSTPKGVVVYASSIESNYLRMHMLFQPSGSTTTASSSSPQHDKHVISIDHPDVCPLLLACECFTMLEGPFWRKIRGRGLAYNYALGLSLDSGLLTFVLQKSTNPVAAWLEAKKIVQEAIYGATPGTAETSEVTKTALLDDPVVLNSARSGMTFDLIAGISTIPNITHGSFLDTISRRGADKVQKVLAKLMDVTAEDLKHVARKYIAPLFGIEHEHLPPQPVVFAVSTPANKLEKTVGELKGAGFEFLQLSVGELEDLYSRKDGYAEVKKKLLEMKTA